MYLIALLGALEVDVRLGVGRVALEVGVVVPPLVPALVDVLHQEDGGCHILGLMQVIDR